MVKKVNIYDLILELQKGSVKNMRSLCNLYKYPWLRYICLLL